MTTTAADPIPEATPATVRAMIEIWAAKHSPQPVALRAKPAGTWRGASREDVPISVVPCPSALAAREALRAATPGEWTVLVTDRPAEDLGAGVLSHLLGMRVYRVDPWESVQQIFHATQSAASFVMMPEGRTVAFGLVRTMPPHGWPAAPGGILTREHALDSVLAARLGLAASDRDMLGLVRWSTRPEAADALAALRRDAGHELTSACLDRAAEAAGLAQAAVRPLLDGDRPGDIAPLGLVVQLLTSGEMDADERQDAAVCLARGERWWRGALTSSDPAMRAFGDSVARAVETLLGGSNPESVWPVADRADALLAEVEGRHLARYSDALPSGRRIRADDLGRALAEADDAGVAPVEEAWQALSRHHLARRYEGEHRALQAAVRLGRWLVLGDKASPDGNERGSVAASGDGAWPTAVEPGAALSLLARQQLDDAAWADAAINVAAAGVGTDIPARGIERVVRRALARREAQARAFAQVLARATAADVGRTDGVVGDGSAGVVLIEKVLDRVVAPLVRSNTPVLLVVLDGLSSGVGTTVAASAVQGGWEEFSLPEAPGRRPASIAVLPTLTEASRCSLLSGELGRGGRQAEEGAYAAYVDSRLKRRGRLFHKATVDTTRSGFALSAEVAEAIDDVDGLAAVAVVLNTIDDALDRSDPAGTTWTADAVKHLEPVLDRALVAGRTVVITGDHGHIVERRDGHQTNRDLAESARNRAVGDGFDEAEEVLVEGRRVMTGDHRAVLAVSEQLRYGPLKAGYHGGAHPAEVVVPVIVLRAPSSLDADDGLALPPQEPAWWVRPVESAGATAAAAAAVEAAAHAPQRKRGAGAGAEGPALFDLPADRTEAAAARPSLGARVVDTDVYQAQLATNPRVASGRPLRVAGLIDAFAATRDSRLARVSAAQALGVSLARLRGAQEQARQLLNVEGYPVLRVDTDGQTLVLDIDMLCEQFGVSRER